MLPLRFLTHPTGFTVLYTVGAVASPLPCIDIIAYNVEFVKGFLKKIKKILL